jgi:hypothetical protein
MICFGCLKRFRGSNIIGYFSNIRLSKSDAASASSLGTTSADLLIDKDDAQIGDTQATPIQLTVGAPIHGFQNSSTMPLMLSSSRLREYPTVDPRYVHQIAKLVPLRSCETPHSICN